eukprot:TRINITY_DN3645_c0_g1_i2.p1 TRINITY_DN3645_c0_g1~~TRINITY_DN3645_c0_g1_i2.p1  ORF type:complete len:120 (+),score=56.14 TRINITY_DN3645_c0_g1_i2:279-638(+)
MCVHDRLDHNQHHHHHHHHVNTIAIVIVVVTTTAIITTITAIIIRSISISITIDHNFQPHHRHYRRRFSEIIQGTLKKPSPMFGCVPQLRPPTPHKKKKEKKKHPVCPAYSALIPLLRV